MTDIEKFIQLYKSVGIHLKPEVLDGRQRLVLTAQITEKVDGYSEFYTLIDFDKNGKFIEQSIWE